MRTYTVRPAAPLVLAAPVATIEPHGNPVVVTGDGIKATEVTGDEIFDAEAAAGLRLTAVKTAHINVTYVEEAPPHPKTVRGSSTAGDTGSYESRSVDELYAEAKAKDIPGRSGMDKAELIVALRAEG